jgi:glycosyltransferase involved in cell wall biosynthesis
VRLLFLLPDFPYPPSTGGRLKVFNILKYMSLNHQCDIFCFGNPDIEARNALLAAMPRIKILEVFPLIAGKKKVLLSLWNLARLLPPSFAAFANSEYTLKLQHLLEKNKYDVIHYDIINTAQFIEYGSQSASVHSPNDATSMVYFRVARSLSWSFQKCWLLVSAFLLRRFEFRTYSLFDKVHVVSEGDAKYLANLVPGIDVNAIPIAVDDALLDVHLAGVSVASMGPFRIICTGNLNNPAIAGGVEEFIRIALPAISAQIPNVQFVVLGKNFNESLILLCRGIPGIQLLDWVDDYRQFMLTADVVLVPDRTGPDGAKTRTIEAMSLKLPVVGTRTAFAGIPFINERHGLLYQDAGECGRLIVDLLRDRKRSQSLGAEAFRMVTNSFSLSVVGPHYEHLYQSAISKFRSARRVTSASQ